MLSTSIITCSGIKKTDMTGAQMLSLPSLYDWYPTMESSIGSEALAYYSIASAEKRRDSYKFLYAIAVALKKNV